MPGLKSCDCILKWIICNCFGCQINKLHTGWVLFVDTDISNLLIRFNQEHILRLLDCMNRAEKRNLLRDIRQVDLGLVADLYESYRMEQNRKKDKKVFQEVEVLSFNRSEASRQNRKRLFSIGEDCLKEGRVALFLVAGGQGTRLGIKGPKGCFAISPVKRKTLFQLFAETIKALQRRYGKPLNWFIMTSQENNEETHSFFYENNFFGLKRKNIHFLIQGQIPSLDLNGKLIISRDKRIYKNPNGHGGAIYALHDSGALEQMAQEGIEEIFYFQVDNPLVKIADPLFIGAHVEHQAEMSSKAVKKVDAAEKVGVLGRVNGRLGCIEYSELSQKEANERKSDGELRFNSANIAIHMLSRNFVEKLSRGDDFKLPYHTAVKEIEGFGPDNNGQAPNKFNGIKFEMFIFDALGVADSSVVLEVSREEQFAPVKNKTGSDSPETARKAMIGLHKNWLKNSAKAVSISDSFVIEVSPLYALDEETFRKKFTTPPSQIISPLYLE